MHIHVQVFSSSLPLSSNAVSSKAWSVTHSTWNKEVVFSEELYYKHEKPGLGWEMVNFCLRIYDISCDRILFFLVV